MDFPDWEILPDHEFTNNLRITQDSDPKNNSLDYSDFILCPHDPLHPPIPSEPTIVKTIYTNPDHHDDDDNDDEVKSASSHVSFEKKDNQFVDTTVVNSVDNDALKFETEMGDSNKEEDKNSGFNLWKWSLNGVGAICTFGVTAATICVLILGTHQKNKHHVNQKSVFSFYTDDKVTTWSSVMVFLWLVLCRIVIVIDLLVLNWQWVLMAED